MAFPVYQSVSTTAFASTSNLVITKPSGLTVGDLMYATVYQFLQGATTSLSAPAGWTIPLNFSVIGGTSHIALVAYKIADSSDVAASNFTFTSNRSGIYGGGIIRISGVSSSNPVQVAQRYTQSHSPRTDRLTATATATPFTTESLIIITPGLLSFVLDVAPTTNTYTSTPSVTFTERFDLGYRDGSSDGGTLALATGEYTGSTQFTAYGAVFSDSNIDHTFGTIAIINGTQNATGTNTLHTISPDFFLQSGAGGSTIGSNALLEVSPTLFDQSGEGIQPTQWTTISKS